MKILLLHSLIQPSHYTFYISEELKINNNNLIFIIFLSLFVNKIFDHKKSSQGISTVSTFHSFFMANTC